MKPGRTRQYCKRRLAELGDWLDIPCPFDAQELARQISTLRGCRIELVALPMATGAPYGVTLYTDDAHVIAYERHTSRVHQDHIIAHELGHVLLGHVGVEIDTEQAAQQLFPALRPSLVRRILGRAGVYTQVEEFEAEIMATLLLELSCHRPPSIDDLLVPQQAAVAARLRETLETRYR